MVTPKTLKSYGFASMEDYFQYIMDSKTNGQHAQAKTLAKELSAKQKRSALQWSFSFLNEKDRKVFIATLI